MLWDNEFALEIFPALLEGFKTTLLLTTVGMAISLIVGLIVAVLRRADIPVLSPLLNFYVSFIRGTPLLVQAYCAFFVLPTLGVQADALTTGIVVIGLNYSAYTAEVYRSGIQEVAVGQWEAATALNLPVRVTWARVILPQAVGTTIPMLGNYLILMFKDSAVLSAITVVEMLSVAQRIGSANFRYLEPLTIAGLIFLVVSFLASNGIRVLERLSDKQNAR